MKTWIALGTTLALGLGVVCQPVRAQVVERERDVTITGPRGRSIERQVTSERGPGFVDRQVQIQRPGGTFHSETFAHRAPGGLRPSGFVPGPVYRGGWGPRFVERDVIIRQGGPGWLPALALGGGLFGLGMLTGSALSTPPPPPVIVAPAPVPYVVMPAGQPAAVYPAQPVVAAPPPPTVVAADPGADAMTRLRSMHEHSRRDGALTLGRLRDARAVPALTNLLQHDLSKEVRMASAWALGEIGDQRSAMPLQRAAMFDRRQEVRTAAAEAYARLPHEVPGDASAPAPAPAANSPGAEPPLSTAAAPTGTTPTAALRANDVPPPPPTPAVPPPFATRSAARVTPGFPD